MKKVTVKKQLNTKEIKTYYIFRLFNSSVRKNLANQLFLQLMNYIFPLLTFPYLTRVLNTEHYGVIALSYSFAAYVNMLSDYGFSFTAVRICAINRNNKTQLSFYINSVYTIKLFLFLLVILGSLILFYYNAVFREYWYIFTISLVGSIANLLFPTWLFQGIEQTKYITWINLLFRGMQVVGVFSLVHKDSQFVIVPMLNSLVFVGCALMSQIILYRQYSLKFSFVGYAAIIAGLKEGWHLFVSNLAVIFYTTTNTFFLGLITKNMTYVAYYASVEKLTSAVQGIIGVVSVSLFPFVTRMLHEDKIKGIKALQGVFYTICIIGFVLGGVLFVFNHQIITLVLGDKYLTGSTKVLNWLCWLPLLIPVSSILGVQTMLAFDFKKQFSMILLAGGALNVCLIFLLVPLFNYQGAAASVFITELFVVIAMICVLNINGIYIWRGIIMPMKGQV